MYGLNEYLDESLRCCCRKNSAHIRQSGPESGPGFQVEGLEMFYDVPSSFDRGMLAHLREHINQHLSSQQTLLPTCFTIPSITQPWSNFGWNCSVPTGCSGPTVWAQSIYAKIIWYICIQIYLYIMYTDIIWDISWQGRGIAAFPQGVRAPTVGPNKNYDTPGSYTAL